MISSIVRMEALEQSMGTLAQTMARLGQPMDKEAGSFLPPAPAAAAAAVIPFSTNAKAGPSSNILGEMVQRNACEGWRDRE